MHRGINFMKKVLDGMHDWVRVVDAADSVVYMNRAMKRALETNPDARAYFSRSLRPPDAAKIPIQIAYAAEAGSAHPARVILPLRRPLADVLDVDLGWRSRGDFVRTGDDVDAIAHGDDVPSAPDAAAAQGVQNNPDTDADDLDAADFSQWGDDGLPEQQADKEIRLGHRTYAVISSPIYNRAGEQAYVIEVFRDVTRLKDLQSHIIAQNQKFEYDLDMAKMLQRRLLPGRSPNSRIDFQYVYRPCDMLGGDFVDIYNIGKDHLGMYIADVSGHGVSASVLTVFLRSTISKRITSPAEALSLLYREYNKNNFEPDVYITVFYAIFDLKRGMLTYSNAGHNGIPVLYNKRRADQQRRLQVPGLPISNWLDEGGYTEERVAIESGDMLFMYTDGLVEIMNAKREMFGSDRLSAALMHSDASDSARLLASVLKTAFSFAGIESKSMLSDDLTMSIAEVV